jgi:peptidyl-prolyl cis-trans isomerase A (cyclophilin A)
MKPTLLLPLAALLFGAFTTSPLFAQAATKEAKAEKAPAAADPAAAASLADPSKLTEKAPDSFKVKVSTTKGDFTLQLSRPLSPNGADRFYNLVKAGFFTDIAYFRVIPGFMGQFGIQGDPIIATAWRGAKIDDDAVKGSNIRGAITFAMAGPNTRTTQFFINLANNPNLDSSGFSPFGKVIEGMDIVDKLNGEYGEGAPSGRGPNQMRVQSEGNAYLKKEFPRLDYIKSATLLPAEADAKK